MKDSYRPTKNILDKRYIYIRQKYIPKKIQITKQNQICQKIYGWVQIQDMNKDLHIKAKLEYE